MNRFIALPRALAPKGNAKNFVEDIYAGHWVNLESSFKSKKCDASIYDRTEYWHMIRKGVTVCREDGNSLNVKKNGGGFIWDKMGHWEKLYRYERYDAILKRETHFNVKIGMSLYVGKWESG